jgi:hypothetical protein
MDESTTYVPLRETFEMCRSSVCASGRAGHSVLPIQERVASASPSAWRDALITASADGVLEVALLDGDLREFWNHDDLGLAIGEPVAWHPVAGIISAAGKLRSVTAL